MVEYLNDANMESEKQQGLIFYPSHFSISLAYASSV